MTISLGEISVRYVNLLLDTAAMAGADIQPCLDHFNIRKEQREQPHATVSIPKFMRIGQWLIQHSDLPTLGLLTAQQAKPTLLGLAGYAALCASTNEQALKDIIKFEVLSIKNARGKSKFYREGNYGVAEFYSISPYNEFNHFIVDMALAIQVSILSQISTHSICAHRIEIEYSAPKNIDDYQDFFACPVQFNQPRNAVVFKLTDLQKSPMATNINTYQEAHQLCEQKVMQQSHNLNFIDRVMNEITPLLHSSSLSMAEVAARIDMPEWTLRRRLQTEGTTFTQLLDKTRSDLAKIYLKDNYYTLGEITYLLGFANPNAFQRAFKRWSGCAPGEYRHSCMTNNR